VEVNGVFDALHKNVEHFKIKVNLGLDVEAINDEPNFERVIPYADYEQLNELCMSYFIFLSLLELLVIVLFAVHLEHNEDILSCDQEALSVILSNPLLNLIVNNNFLIVSLIVLSV
jgi:hypothetical protein